MIDLIDANNVMRRGMEKTPMPGAAPMQIRIRYEQAFQAPAGTQIWVWDGKGHNERRRAIFPPYKMNRTPAAEDIFAQIRLFRQILRHTPQTQIAVEGWEADDVIGTLVRKKPGVFKVHTNDMDYGQIAHLCQLDGVNLKGVPPRWVALYKALVGDKSDNIPGIPQFGPKLWDRLEDWWPQIERAIVQGNPASFVGLPFTKSVTAWLADEDNVRLLQQMLTVTHFQNVPDAELEGGIIFGKPDYQAGHAKLREFFL